MWREAGGVEVEGLVDEGGEEEGLDETGAEGSVLESLGGS